LIDTDIAPGVIGQADTAVFYSINNCLDGLRNISFGAFLIKQVVQELEAEGLKLKNFVTLSPVPRFREWLAQEAVAPAVADILRLKSAALAKALHEMTPADPRRHALRRACAQCLTTRRKSGRANDPVAAFHLNNGASVERINWLGDTSEKGLHQSFGLMVNYAYRPSRIERNHEQYVKHGRVAVSGDVEKLLEEPKAAVRKTSSQKMP
jgi:malonyl-CoA decarboxylase